jgi:integrase
MSPITTNTDMIVNSLKNKELNKITDKEIEALIKYCHINGIKTFTFETGFNLSIIDSVNGVWRYRFTFESKRNDTDFGKYPSFSLKQARDKLKYFKEQIEKGINPILEKKEKKEIIKKEKELKKAYEVNTIYLISEKYLTTKQNHKNLKDITIDKARARLKEHFFNHLPKKEKTPIYEITLEHIVKALEIIQDDNKLETLSRLKMLIVGVYEYAYANEIIEDSNIFTKLKLKSFKIVHKANVKNHSTVTDEANITKLYNGMINYKYGFFTKYALLLSVHTAQRQGSIRSSKWSDIDFQKKLWTIPAEKMKMKKEHIVPLSKVMIQYLKELYKITGTKSEYLFPNSRDLKKYMCENTVNLAIRKIGFTKEQQTAHGLRAMFKSVTKANQEKYKLSNEYVERILAHTVGSEVENVYLRVAPLEEMRTILNWWSNYLESLNESKKSKPKANEKS